MSAVEILIAVLFLGIPLLGRLLGGSAPPPTLPPPPAGGGEAPARLPAPAPVAVPEPVGGWGDWPGDEEEADEEDEALDEVAGDHDLDVDSIHTAEAMSLEPISASEGVVRALPAPLPASLDVLVVDRSGEHERFHRRIAALAAPAPRPDRLADHLRSRSEVRRAILLAEALGPPKSLRGPDGR
ncbi:MAG TPA: hypothetical protein VF263_20785 [Longimicrobiaceae bacterium]